MHRGIFTTSTHKIWIKMKIPKNLNNTLKEKWRTISFWFNYYKYLQIMMWIFAIISFFSGLVSGIVLRTCHTSTTHVFLNLLMMILFPHSFDHWHAQGNIRKKTKVCGFKQKKCHGKNKIERLAHWSVYMVGQRIVFDGETTKSKIFICMLFVRWIILT